MGLLDRLFGRRPSSDRSYRQEHRPPPQHRPASDGRLSDEQAIERYRYLLRTAPPETIEDAHAEAFAQLTPEQRTRVLAELSRELPERERAAGYDDDPRSLARLATRSEMRQPGSLERSFGGMGGFGGTMASSFLGAFAGLLVGSAIAEQFLGDDGAADQSADGDFGGGDFGGGDFGGGDFGGF